MVLSVLLVLMSCMLALTSCRTAIILTGGYWGSLIFFGMIRRDRKWFLPGIIAVLILSAVFYGGARFLYQANCDRLIKMYSQQYSEQLAPSVSDDSAEPEETAAFDETLSDTEEEYTEEEYTEEEYYEEEYTEEEYYEEEVPADNQEERIPIEVDPDTGEVRLVTDSAQESIYNDFGTLNSRTYIWSATKFAIRETPSILYWGIQNPGWYISFYNFFPIAHLHNAWMECLVGMGVVGFLIAMLFTLTAVWNSLIILLKYNQDIWKRNVALLTLCLLAASVLEPYLFYTTSDYHLTDMLFFLCSGYMVHWVEADNCRIMNWIRSRLFFSKK